MWAIGYIKTQRSVGIFFPKVYLEVLFQYIKDTHTHTSAMFLSHWLGFFFLYMLALVLFNAKSFLDIKCIICYRIARMEHFKQIRVHLFAHI